jgi:hypothetical protein
VHQYGKYSSYLIGSTFHSVLPMASFCALPSKKQQENQKYVPNWAFAEGDTSKIMLNG